MAKVLGYFLVAVIVSACDGSVQLCGEYACVFYQSDCERTNSCNNRRSCESAGSVRDRTPQLINQLRSSNRNCGSTLFASSENPDAQADRAQWDTALELASTNHARDMAELRIETFVGSNGLLTADRVELAGSTATMVVESIGSGPQTAAEIINFWLDIESDCRQMLNPEFTQIALSCALSNEKEPVPFWSLVLAKPEPVKE